MDNLWIMIWIIYGTGWWFQQTPLKNMKVYWDDENPNIWKNKKGSKPPTRQYCARSRLSELQRKTLCTLCQASNTQVWISHQQGLSWRFRHSLESLVGQEKLQTDSSHAACLKSLCLDKSFN